MTKDEYIKEIDEKLDSVADAFKGIKQLLDSSLELSDLDYTGVVFHVVGKVKFLESAIQSMCDR